MNHQQRISPVSGTINLLDILDRVLDKGLVIAGDISISLAQVELLTIRIRLLVCSVEKAEQIGLNWWRYDPNLTGRQLGPAQPPARRVPGRVPASPVARPAARRKR
jgi:hypothetical protein